MKGSKQGVSILSRNLLIKLRGFTILELIVACAILAILMSGLLLILQQGEFTTARGTAKADLESEVKMITEWITKDVRQAKIQNLTNNAPGYDHLKFNLLGWDNTTNNITYSNSYIEYSYDSTNQTLLREYYDEGSASLFDNTFTNITLAPFYTSFTNETVCDFVDNDLRMEGLIIVVKKEKIVRGKDFNFTMIEKVRIRNE